MAAPAGIPTMHAGIQFRSRLEARWAAFFTEIGWRWEYEPFDLEGYIPDFLVFSPDRSPFLVEVGPCATESEYRLKAEKARKALPAVETLIGPPGDQIWMALPDRRVLIVGVTPRFRNEGWLADAAGFWHTSELDGEEIEAAFWDVDFFHVEGLVDRAWATAVNTTQWRP
jgi:hypothetical protein